MLLLWKAQCIYLQFQTACYGLTTKFTEILSGLVKVKMKKNYNNEKPASSVTSMCFRLVPYTLKVDSLLYSLN